MSRLRKNLLFNVLGQSANLLLSLLAVKFIFKIMGEEAFGLVYFSLAITAALAAAVELGLTSSTVREVSAHFDEDRGYISKLTRTASTIYWGLYLVLLMTVFIGAPYLVHSWLRLSAVAPEGATALVWMLGAAALLLLPRGLYASLLRGRQRMEFTNVIDIAAVTLQQGGIVAILLLKGNLGSVCLWILVSAVVALLAYIWACGRLFPWRALVPGFDLNALRRNVRFMVHMTSVSATSIVHTQADKVVVSKLLLVADFGFYNFASSICSRATLFTTAVTQAALPSLSLLAQTGQTPLLSAQYRKLQDLVSLATLPIFAGIIFGSPILWDYAFTPAVARRMVGPTTLLAVGSYLNGTISLPYMMCLALGRPDIPAKTNLIALVIVLPVTIAMVLRFGMLGGGLSWIFFHVFSYAYFIPKVCRHCLDLTASAWYARVARIMGIGIATYGGTWILLGLGAGATPLRLGVAFIVGSAAYAAAAYAASGTDVRGTVQGWSRSRGLNWRSGFQRTSTDTVGRHRQ